MSVWLASSKGEVFPVEERCSIGRSSGNELVIAHDKVSRRHALVQAQEADCYWILDFGSKNGTYLNARRVVQPMRLFDGDHIEIGGIRLTFRQADAAPGSDHTVAARTALDIRFDRCWLLVADMQSSTRLSRSVPKSEVPRLIGEWLSRCRSIVENADGSINKFVGDGFFAYWPDHGTQEAGVVTAVGELARLQQRNDPKFRIVLHVGQVYIGGSAALVEDSLSGDDVNFVFRMEKLAQALGHDRLLSDSANSRLGNLLASHPAGRHCLVGFDGEHAFHTF